MPSSLCLWDTTHPLSLLYALNSCLSNFLSLSIPTSKWCAPQCSALTHSAPLPSGPGQRAPSVHGFSFPPSAADFPLFSTSRLQGSLHVSIWMSNTSKPMCSHSLFPHQTNSSHGRPPQPKRRKPRSPSQAQRPGRCCWLFSLTPHSVWFRSAGPSSPTSHGSYSDPSRHLLSSTPITGVSASAFTPKSLSTQQPGAPFTNM